MIPDLVRFVEAEGAAKAADSLVEDFNEDYRESPRQAIQDFSMKRCWEAFIGPVEGIGRIMETGGLGPSSVVEEVRSGAFAHVTSNILFNAVQAAYDETQGIVDSLVTPFASNNKTERLVGFTAGASPKDVPEGEEYPDSGFTDRATEGPEPMKRGRMISITEEAIKFDKTGQIVARAQNLGKKLRLDREKYGIYAVEDVAASYCYYPIAAGVPTRTAIFRASAAGTEWYNKTVNLKASNGLVDYTDIEAAWLLYKDVADENGDPIAVSPNVLLVPMALIGTAAQIINATSFEKRTASAVNITMSANAYIQAMGLSGITIATSPFLASASTWYLGDFKSQFYEQVVIPTEVKNVPGDPKRDIVTGYVVRRKSRVYASDDKFVIKNTA